MLARRIAVYSLLVMLGALWGGAYILNFFGVSLAALRIAGGFVVASSAWVLLQRPEQNEEQEAGAGLACDGRGRRRVLSADHAVHDRPGHDRGRDRARLEPAVRQAGFSGVLPRRLGGGGRDRRDGAGRLQLRRPDRGVPRAAAGARGDAARGVPAALRRRADHAERR